MSKSRLSYQVSFCELVENLNNNGCLSVIRLLQQTMKCSNLNGLLVKILNNLSQQFSIDVLGDICHKIEKIVENESCRKQSRTTTITDDSTSNVLFPLLELPHDLVTKTSFFLNENDIFQFEKCCRLFYQMINDTNYLNQSNNFKTLTITDKRLNQMTDSKYSFFKYKKAEKLKFNFHNRLSVHDTEESIKTFTTQLRDKWDQAQMVCSIDNLYTSIFKSIKSIDFDEAGSLLLDKVPINILFNSKLSNLENIEIDYYWNGGDEKYLTKCIKKFESQYLQLKETLNQHGEEIQNLKLLKAIDVSRIETRITGPKYIIVNHLYVDFVTIAYFEYFYCQLKCDNNSINNIKVLTIESDFLFNSKIDTNLSIYASKLCIETLRIIDFDEDCDMDILNDTKIIESLNLQNSLKNVTINVHIYDEELVYHEEIQSIFDKEYFYKLENVNILFDISGTQNDTVIHDIFAFFKENRKKLEYQFKQLNIGLFQYYGDARILACHTFEWDTSISDQFLDKQCNICCQSQQLPPDKLAHKQKFNQWKNQWT